MTFNDLGCELTAFEKFQNFLLSKPNFKDIRTYYQQNNLHKKTSPEYLEKYVTFMSDNSFDVDLIDLLINEANSLYYGGFLVDTEISSEKVQEFFDENKEVLEKIAQEYSNKIDNVNSTSH